MTLRPIFAAAAEAAHAPSADSPLTVVTRQFGWEPRLFFSQMILIILVALVLARYAYKPLLAMLDLRKRQIAEGLENAEKTRKELANAQIKAQEILTQASIQSNKAIEEARASAAKILEQESQKAIATAGDIIAKAKQSNEAELARMKSELRKEIGRLVVATSSKVAGKLLTAEDQSRLAEETNRQMSSN
jgi:F-type H+-transporting ATPase subunit b